MDSPLLPQFDKRSNLNFGDVSLIDDPSMLADLSIDSDIHDGSPVDRHLYIRENSQPRQQQPRAQNLFSSTSSASSHANTNPNRRIQIDHQLDDHSDGEDTPIKNSIKSTTTTKTNKPRFSLFAAPRPPSADQDQDHDEEGRGDEDDTIQFSSNRRPNEDGNAENENEEEQRQRQFTNDNKEDRLRSSLYELRKMNEVFDGFLGALEGVRGHNQRLAERVKQTSALLDEYTSLMGQAEHTRQLLSNPKWTGSADDAEAIQAVELARIQEFERAQEESRRNAELARIAEEERERRLLEREKAESFRGNRGRGGLTRGAGRGIPSGGSRGVGGVRGRGTGIPRPSIAPTARPTSSTSTANRRGISTTNTTTGTTRGGGGLGGQYNHVKSSGYGPR